MKNELSYFDGKPVIIGDLFQKLRFVGWTDKTFEVGAVIDGEIVYEGDLGSYSVYPKECIKFNKKLNDKIREMYSNNTLGIYEVENYIKDHPEILSN